MPKFFVANHQIKDNAVTIVGEDVNHIVNVLRLKKQDEITIGNRDTADTYVAKITDILKEKVICQIVENKTKSIESKLEVTIFQGLPKAEKMEYIIQKCTELGAVKIVPVSMRRSVVKLNEKDAIKKVERWQKIAEVAAKQSQRDVIPTIEKVTSFSEILEQVKQFDLFIVAYEKEENITLKQVLQNKTPIKIGVLIGPEGGLDEEDVVALKNEKAEVVSLGKRILRTETAPVSVLSNIMYEYNG